MPNKKENQNNQPVTKKELNETIDKAMQKQSKYILDEVDIRIDKAMQEQSRVILGAVSEEFKKVYKRIDEFERDNSKTLDLILKRLDDLAQENQASTNLYKRHDKALENHEKRINNLETVKQNK